MSDDLLCAQPGLGLTALAQHHLIAAAREFMSSRARADCALWLACAGTCPPAELHVYDKEKNYVPFDAQEPETFFEVQRKVIPNSA